MLAVGLVVGALTLGGPGLLGGDLDTTSDPGVDVTEIPVPPAMPGGAAALIAGTGALLAALATRGPGAGLGLRTPDDAVVVFVPGHGQGTAGEAFGTLIEMMGLDGDAVRGFDHRWVTGHADAKTASQLSPIGPTAASLNAYLAGVGAAGDPVWLIGFSKGGATIAELIAAWDRGLHRPPVDVRGAFLLDPPIARGMHGAIQSAGRVAGVIPDDGGYDPVECTFLRLGCHDTRVDLGRASGVEVLVIRNPLAGITSFLDSPSGLRVVDAPDGGPGPWGQLVRNPFGLPGRIATAHTSVLTDPAVARCIVAEMASPGSCRVAPMRLPSLRPIARLLPSAQIV